METRAHGAPPGLIGLVHRRLLLALVAVLIVVGACTMATPSWVSIHTGPASAAEGAISIEADGWTYGVALDGVAWTDAADVRHESGRPDCLHAGQCAWSRSPPSRGRSKV